MNMQEFGKRIAVLRSEKKIPQVEVAVTVGVDVQTVAKWEEGLEYPSMEVIPALANVLDTTVDYLFGCVKKRQMLFCFNVEDWEKQPSNGLKCRRKYEAMLNDRYLAHGWRIVESSISSQKELSYLLIIIEKND